MEAAGPSHSSVTASDARIFGAQVAGDACIFARVEVDAAIFGRAGEGRRGYDVADAGTPWTHARRPMRVPFNARMTWSTRASSWTCVDAGIFLNLRRRGHLLGLASTRASFGRAHGGRREHLLDACISSRRRRRNGSPRTEQIEHAAPNTKYIDPVGCTLSSSGRELPLGRYHLRS